MYINSDAEEDAIASGWTYESGYSYGYDDGSRGDNRENYYPRFTSAWYG